MTTSDAGTPGPAGRGLPGPVLRPREKALLTATLEILRETGYDKLTIDQVAARAQSSKATVYRRWPNKAELVCAAFIHQIPADPVVPDTGTLRGDLLAMAKLMADNAYRFGPVMAGILGAGKRSPRLRELIAQALYRSRSVQVHAVLSRAATRGEIAPAAFSDSVWDVLPGCLLFHTLLHDRPVELSTLTALVDEIVLPSMVSRSAVARGAEAGSLGS